MSADLTFMMGQYEASIPSDRLYAKNHMWAQRREDVYRFGFTAYAVRLLQDVYFLDWTIDPVVQLEARQEIGSIESKKAESGLYAPVSGQLTALNENLMDDPSAINVDKYGAGWLFEIRGDSKELLTPEQYMRHLDSVWKVTQRTIKGQLNAS